MNRQEFSSINWSLLIDWLTNDVDDSTKGLWSDWHHNWVTSVVNFLSSNETLSGIQSNGSNIVTTQMLSDFQNESVWNSSDFEGVQNWWEVTLKLHIDDGTDNLRNLTNSRGRGAKSSYLITKEIG